MLSVGDSNEWIKACINMCNVCFVRCDCLSIGLESLLREKMQN